MIKKEWPFIYKRLYNDLKKSIDDGKYNIGDLLPSENDLCVTYNTTRLTVRHALRELIERGYIVRHHGKGSIVSERKNSLGILSIRGITAAVGEKNLKTSIINKPEIIIWPDDFFYELNEASRKAGCIFFTRLRYVNKIPIVYEETYITNISLPRFTNLNLENRSLFNTLKENYEIEVKGGEQKIWAVAADKNISKFLKVKISSPIVHMKRKLITNENNITIYSSLYCNTEEFYLQDYF